MSNSESDLQPFVDWTWCAGNLGRFVLVDTRWYLDGTSGRDAYDAGHIPGAKLIPVGEVLNHVGEMPRDKTIITYCS